MVKFEQLKRLITRDSPGKPKAREVYAVLTGKYVGEMLTYCEQSDNTYFFISVPKLANRAVPIDKFELGVSSKIVEFVQVLPKNVYKLLYKQYQWNKSKANQGNSEDSTK